MIGEIFHGSRAGAFYLLGNELQQRTNYGLSFVEELSANWVCGYKKLHNKCKNKGTLKISLSIVKPAQCNFFVGCLM